LNGEEYKGKMFAALIALSIISDIAAETLIFSEDWSKGIDFSTWKHEIVSG
jgi:hypothetical protein